MVATKARDKFRALRASLNPLPSGPSMADSFTRTFSKVTSVVLESRRPILFSCFPMVMPGASASMIKAEIPLLPLSGLVLKNPTITEARAPLVIKVLFPFRMYSSPSFTAVAAWPPGLTPRLARSGQRPRICPASQCPRSIFPAPACLPGSRSAAPQRR